MATLLAGGRQFGPYLTLGEVKQWLRFPANADTSRDANLQRIIDMACSKVQARINRPVGAQMCWERHDGWSGEYIMLKESPFLSLISCVEWQSSGGAVTLVESTPENPVDGIQINYATSRIMRTFAGYSWPRPFFPGSRNIEIVYEAGLNPVPGDIWMATAEWVSDWWRLTQQTPAGRAPSAGTGGDQPDTTMPYKGMPRWVEDMLVDWIKGGVA